jgi:hypothetical protein
MDTTKRQAVGGTWQVARWARGAALAAGALLAACTPVNGDGHIVQRTEALTGFEAVGVSHGIHATVRTGAETSVVLRGDENLLRHITLAVSDGKLQTEVPVGVNLWPSEPITLTVTLPTLRGVSASGGSEVDAAGANAGPFTVKASGGSRVRVAGEAAELRLTSSGGSEVTADGLPVATLQVDASGGSQLRATVSGSVRGEMSGGSKLTVAGRPTVAVDLSGGSQVVTDGQVVTDSAVARAAAE